MTVTRIATKASVPHWVGPFNATKDTPDGTHIGYTPPAGSTLLMVVRRINEAFDVSDVFLQTGDTVGSGGNINCTGGQEPFQTFLAGTVWKSATGSTNGLPAGTVTAEEPVFSTQGGSANTTGNVDVWLCVLEPPA